MARTDLTSYRYSWSFGANRDRARHNGGDAAICTGGRAVKGRHFDQEIVVLNVRWYVIYKLSYRDLVAMIVVLANSDRVDKLGVVCAVKGAGSQREGIPPGNWFAPPGSNRTSSGGNEAAEASGAEGRF